MDIKYYTSFRYNTVTPHVCASQGDCCGTSRATCRTRAALVDGTEKGEKAGGPTAASCCVTWTRHWILGEPPVNGLTVLPRVLTRFNEIQHVQHRALQPALLLLYLKAHRSLQPPSQRSPARLGPPHPWPAASPSPRSREQTTRRVWRHTRPTN